MTYYVDPAGDDSAAGTSPATAWRTLAKVNATGFLPGDTVAFKAGGTWTGQLAPTASGAAGAPITFTSYGDAGRARIDGAGRVTSAVLLADLKHVVLDGLDVTNTGACGAYRNGVNVTARDSGELPGIVLRNLTVHDVDGPTGTHVNIGYGGILVNVRGCAVPTYFRDLLIENNHVARVPSYGIVTWSTWMQREGWNALWEELGIPAGEFRPFTPTEGLVIRGNRVEDIGNGGINPNQARNVLIEHNTVLRTSMQHRNAAVWWSGVDDIVVQHNEVAQTHYNGPMQDSSAFDADESVHGSLVQYNYSHDNGGGFFMTCSAHDAPTESVVRYNISENDRGYVFMFIVANTARADIYNNTVYATKSTVDEPLLGMVHQDGLNHTGIAFRNNVFVNPLAAPYHARDAEYSGNLYHGGPVPEDLAAVIGDPCLTAPGSGRHGYGLGAGSPALAAGRTVLGDGGRDHFGAPLPGAAPDLGAVQSAAAATWDGEILDLRAAQVVDSVELAVPYGRGAPPVDVQIWESTGWTTAVSGARLDFASDTGTVEYRTVRLPHPVTTGKVRVVAGGLTIRGVRAAGGGSPPAPVVTSSYGTSKGTLHHIADGWSGTSWASARGVTFPGDVTVCFPAARPVGSVTLSVSHGRDQGVTGLDIQTWDGSAWVTRRSGVTLTWDSDTATVESRTITLPAPVTTERVRLIVTAANLAHGRFALHGMDVGAGGRNAGPHDIGRGHDAIEGPSPVDSSVA
ncbi:discoidin domain-containing protein [Sinosporangium siamense]|uniref:Right-handed parallel beta-helix repeat-containing protein n=1 Tax=Sinosporangium siamense TaxID=1367973 RepID=A0A919VFG2_9ACTN|nr:discoidin domain-containing protein [Sinosporangium siamense]GII96094.1 hypothetical protein Ssi02_63250 [Sinosporangium siamense]